MTIPLRTPGASTLALVLVLAITSNTGSHVAADTALVAVTVVETFSGDGRAADVVLASHDTTTPTMQAPTRANQQLGGSTSLPAVTTPDMAQPGLADSARQLDPSAGEKGNPWYLQPLVLLLLQPLLLLLLAGWVVPDLRDWIKRRVASSRRTHPNKDEDEAWSALTAVQAKARRRTAGSLCWFMKMQDDWRRNSGNHLPGNFKKAWDQIRALVCEIDNSEQNETAGNTDTLRADQM